LLHRFFLGFGFFAGVFFFPGVGARFGEGLFLGLAPLAERLAGFA
jgi:hypothetical protein